MTLYLQKVLGFSPLLAGLSFGVLRIGTVIGGSVAPKVIGKVGTRSTLIIGGLLQTVATAALLGLGDDRSWMWLLLVGTFAGGVGNMLVIVGFMVTVYYVYACVTSMRWVLRCARMASRHLAFGLWTMVLGLFGLMAASVNRLVWVFLSISEHGSRQAFHVVNTSMTDWALGIVLIGICYSASVQMLLCWKPMSANSSPSPTRCATGSRTGVSGRPSPHRTDPGARRTPAAARRGLLDRIQHLTEPVRPAGPSPAGRSRPCAG